MAAMYTIAMVRMNIAVHVVTLASLFGSFLLRYNSTAMNMIEDGISAERVGASTPPRTTVAESGKELAEKTQPKATVFTMRSTKYSIVEITKAGSSLFSYTITCLTLVRNL